MTMTANEAEQKLDGLVYRIASSIGFERIEGLKYRRPTHDATTLLSFPWRLSARGCALFTVWVGLRFEPLAAWLDEDPSEMQPTLVRPIHFLREDKSFNEWEFSNTDDLEELSDTLLNDLKKYALPFAERYSQLGELRKILESSNKQDWLSAGLNVDSRVTVLAAIQIFEGDKDGAIKTLDNALLERKTALPKRRFEIEHLRKRLLVSN
jgi:hypothetical protein